MNTQIYSFILAPDWKLINKVSHIDRFGGSWETIGRREGQILKQFKSIATVRSIDASTRIEGFKMTDDEVGALILNFEISKLEERDQQVVPGILKFCNLYAILSFQDVFAGSTNAS